MQKTVIEMIISVWSSDVCSSDLRSKRAAPESVRLRKPQRLQLQALARAAVAPLHVQRQQHQPCRAGFDGVAGARGGVDVGIDAQVPAVAAVLELAVAVRSEEHTSELQSLMRISYAVFCLKKKKTTTSNNNWTQQ